MSSYGPTGAPDEFRPPTTPVLGALPPPAAPAPPRTAPPAEEEDEATQAGGTIFGQQNSAEQTVTETTADAAEASLAAAAPMPPWHWPTTPNRTDDPEPGRVYATGGVPDAGHVPELRQHPFPALHIGAHVANDAALAAIRPATARTGIVLGVDQGRRPVTVRLFRPEPTRVALVGGLWAAQLTAFRALAVGARVVVFTGRPQAWQGFGWRATGRDDQVSIVHPSHRVTVPAAAQAPSLLLYDEGRTGASVPPGLTSWQTQLTVLTELTESGFPAVREADLVATQRLGPEESAAAVAALGLPRSTADLLSTLRDDMMALLGGDGDEYFWVSPTSVEQQQFGLARR